jgi:hypothetical protein
MCPDDPVDETAEGPDDERAQRAQGDAEPDAGAEAGGASRRRGARERRSAAEQWAEEQRRAWRERRERRAQERKERVVHTRISDELHSAIQRVSDELRVPVSNLIRNSLEDAFRVGAAVGGLVDELVEKARSRGRPSPGARRDAGKAGGTEAHSAATPPCAPASGADTGAVPPADGRSAPRAQPGATEILGWQPLVVDQTQTCEMCGGHLERGSDAYIAVLASGPTARYACTRCVRARP